MFAKDFVRDVVLSLNPFKYASLRERPLRRSILFLLVLVAFSTLISSFVYLPSIFSGIKDMESSFSDFEILRLNPEISTEKPIHIFDESFLVLDTTSNISQNRSKDSRYYIDSDFFYYNYGENRRELEKVGNLLEYEEEIFGFLGMVTVFLIPSFLVGYYAFSVLLFIALLVLLSLLAFLVLKLIGKKKIVFSEIMSAAFYTSTFLAIGMILNSFNFSVRILVLVVSFLYILIGSILSHKKVKKTKNNEKKDDDKNMLGDI